MSDLIDRGEAIRRLCAECSNMGSFACISCKILSIIKSIPSVNRWIPCSERMPEEGQDVIIYIAKGWDITPIQVAHIQYDSTLWEFSDGEFYPSKNEVSHWMPLPEPPEEE